MKKFTRTDEQHATPLTKEEVEKLTLAQVESKQAALKKLLDTRTK